MNLNTKEEGVQKHHSVTIMLKFFAGNLTREQEIGIFWRLAGKAESLVHNNQEKPYMFYINPVNTSEGLYELNVNSIDPNIIEACYESVTALVKAGEAVDVQGLKVRPVDAFYVKDLDYIGEKVCLTTETGLCCCKRIRTKTGRRSRYYLDPRKSSDIEEWKAILARKLSDRTKQFMDIEIPAETINIDILDVQSREFITYKSANLPTDRVQVEISAVSPVIFAAIYGGLGSHTGAGFGAVRVSKKKLKRNEVAA